MDHVHAGDLQLSRLHAPEAARASQPIQHVRGETKTEPMAKPEHRFPMLLPGSYVFRISRQQGGRVQSLLTLDPVRIAPGDDRTLDLHFSHRVARIRLVDAENRPVPRRLVRIGASGHHQHLVSDRNGWVVVDPAPSRQFQLSVYRPGITNADLFRHRFDSPKMARTNLGSMQLEANAKTTTVVLSVRN